MLHVEQAYVPEEKITHYLLNVNHDEGRGKALFFLRMGFSVEKWEELAQALVLHAHENEMVKEEVTRFGTRYVVEGELTTPNEHTIRLRSVWFVSTHTSAPRLITAYPLEEDDD